LRERLGAGDQWVVFLAPYQHVRSLEFGSASDLQPESLVIPPLQQGVLSAAERQGALLVSLENVYGYGPTGHKSMTEDLPLAAMNRSGVDGGSGVLWFRPGPGGPGG
jgi:hypothetical protein